MKDLNDLMQAILDMDATQRKAAAEAAAEREERLGRLAVYYNPENVPHTVALPAGNWRTVCDGVTASPQPFGPVRSGQIELPPVSAVILAAQAAPGG